MELLHFRAVLMLDLAFAFNFGIFLQVIKKYFSVTLTPII